MSMGSMGGILGSAAGVPLSQTKGSATEQAKQAASAAERTVESERKTEKASGVGQTEGDSETSDRDADGRRLWERNDQGADSAEGELRDSPSPPSKEGGPGGALDLTA